MLESPLVPDGSAPGTQVPSRPERPLTRRELREREAAALRLEGERTGLPQGGGALGAASHGAADPLPSGQPRAQRPGFDDFFAAAVPATPAATRGATHPTSVSPAATRGAGHPTPPPGYPTPAPTWGAGHPTRTPGHPTPPPAYPTPTPGHPTPPPGYPTPTVASSAVAPSHPIPGTAPASPAPRRRTADQFPLPTFEAEQTDRPVGRSSASAVSPGRGSDTGFDAIFAGLGDDDLDETRRDDRSRSPRSGRPSRADRKAAKGARSMKAPKAAKVARARGVGPRRSGEMPNPPVAPGADFATLLGGAAAADIRRATPTPPSPSGVPTPTPSLSLSASPASPPSPAAPPPMESRRPAPAPRNLDLPTRRNASTGSADPTADPVSDLFGLAAEPSSGRADGTVDAAADLFGIATSSEHDGAARSASSNGAARFASSAAAAPSSAARRSGPSRARRDAGSTTPQHPTRDAHGVQRVARDATRSAGPRTNKVRVRMPRPTSRPATSPTARRRGGRVMASVAAMSFAALLAVATTIPSLSLLSPADVQALAMSSTNAPGPDGQRVELNGDIVAQGLQREGYASQTIDEYARAAGIRPEATFTNNPAGTIQWPFAVGVHIGDRFGYRDCWGCSSDHGGQDFNPGLGAEIQAIADGVVSVSTDSGGSLGVVMMIDHIIDGELITSVYAHMEYDSRRFEVGDTVHVGDIVGTTGSTGMSTGPHLHFEIRVGGVDGTKIDPLEWLYANTN